MIDLEPGSAAQQVVGLDPQLFSDTITLTSGIRCSVYPGILQLGDWVYVRGGRVYPARELNHTQSHVS